MSHSRFGTRIRYVPFGSPKRPAWAARHSEEPRAIMADLLAAKVPRRSEHRVRFLEARAVLRISADPRAPASRVACRFAGRASRGWHRSSDGGRSEA